MPPRSGEAGYVRRAIVAWVVWETAYLASSAQSRTCCVQTCKFLGVRVIKKKMEQPQTSTFHLADQAVSSKGQKACQLTANHQPVRFQLGTGLKTKWGATNYDKTDTPRRNLDFDLTEHEDVLETLRAVDKWAIQYIAAHSDRLLKKTMTAGEVELRYQPLVKTYGASAGCKTKINLRGSRAATFWMDENGHSIQLPNPPDDNAWQDWSYDVFCSIPQLWVMNNDFGFILETLAVKLQAHAPAPCPFT